MAMSKWTPESNPMILRRVGKTSEEVATMEARWAMLDEAKKRGITVNETLNGQIEAQAAQVGQLTAELERAEIAQQQFDEAVDGIADAFAGGQFPGLHRPMVGRRPIGRLG